MISDQLVSAIDECSSPALSRPTGPTGSRSRAPATRSSSVVTGVSASSELFERAVEPDAQLVLVHHGLFWDVQPDRADAGAGRAPAAAVRARHRARRLPPAARRAPRGRQQRAARRRARLRRARAVRRLQAARRSGAPARSPATGSPPREPRSRACASVTGREPLVHGCRPRPRPPHRASCPAAAADVARRRDRARARRVPHRRAREHVMAEAREAGIHFIAAGHYATETFGVRALGELARRAASGSSTSSSTSRIRSERIV